MTESYESYTGVEYVLKKDEQFWTAKIENEKLFCICYGKTKKHVRQSARRTIDWIINGKSYEDLS